MVYYFPVVTRRKMEYLTGTVEIPGAGRGRARRLRRRGIRERRGPNRMASTRFSRLFVEMTRTTTRKRSKTWKRRNTLAGGNPNNKPVQNVPEKIIRFANEEEGKPLQNVYEFTSTRNELDNQLEAAKLMSIYHSKHKPRIEKVKQMIYNKKYSVHPGLRNNPEYVDLVQRIKNTTCSWWNISCKKKRTQMKQEKVQMEQEYEQKGRTKAATNRKTNTNSRKKTLQWKNRLKIVADEKEATAKRRKEREKAWMNEAKQRRSYNELERERKEHWEEVKKQAAIERAELEEQEAQEAKKRRARLIALAKNRAAANRAALEEKAAAAAAATNNTAAPKNTANSVIATNT